MPIRDLMLMPRREVGGIYRARDHAQRNHNKANTGPNNHDGVAVAAPRQLLFAADQPPSDAQARYDNQDASNLQERCIEVGRSESGLCFPGFPLSVCFAIWFWGYFGHG